LLSLLKKKEGVPTRVLRFLPFSVDSTAVPILNGRNLRTRVGTPSFFFSRESSTSLLAQPGSENCFVIYEIRFASARARRQSATGERKPKEALTRKNKP